MKAYIITTGLIFALVTLAHLLRVITENRHLITEPFFLAITVITTALSLWAFFVWRRSRS